MYRSYIILLVIFSLCACHRLEKTRSIMVDLDSGWQFHRANSDTVYPADVPGCVHLDLMKNGLIPDPYYRDNELKVQWVENEDWIYETSFIAPENPDAYDRIELVFEGLDTYADVYLNGEKMTSTDNMFRRWSIDLEGGGMEHGARLKPGRNEVKVYFHSPVKINADKAARAGYKLPDDRAFTRKAPYMWGWDWGPRLVTSGIWKPVYLRAWNNSRISYCHVRLDSLSDHEAYMAAIVEVEATERQQSTITFQIPSTLKINKRIKLAEGFNRIEIPFIIENPRLWWTHNLGESYLYDFQLSVKTNGEKTDKITDRFGIRTIEVVEEPDSVGTSFCFKLNQIPVFMKGANYIPQDNFPSRVDSGRYESLIRQVLEANMNMLRVWGGGIYENDLFYDLCDENGILVWQDFMFACTMYPVDDAFAENVKEEARQQVTRLGNHPCIALWCGNNEVDEGWHNWGWQKQLGYTKEDEKKIWQAYENIFHRILPSVVNKIDSNVFYWPSSPKNGWGRSESLTEGDVHYWGVWWGREPFSAYKKKVGRFMSEYGFQGYPDTRTIEWFTKSEDRYISSPVMKVHQKHPFGEEAIRQYMEWDYPVPADFVQYTYISQINQAEGIRMAIETHRRAMPYCMGTLYWQLNDCWPVISWSGLDYFYRWKALHYFVRKAYADVLVSPVTEEGQLKVYAVSDLMKSLQCVLQLKVLDFSGKNLASDSIAVTIKANSSQICYRSNLDSLLNKADRLKSYLRVSITVNKEIIAENSLYFLSVKDLRLPRVKIKYEIEKKEAQLVIRLHSDKLAKNVWLSFPDVDGHFSDNYFDLIPGEVKEVIFRPLEKSLIKDNFDLKILTINDLIH